MGQPVVLDAAQWFREGHGIEGGRKNRQGIWLPMHACNRMCYIWTPPPIIADVALEECLKAVHKRTNVVLIFLIPRLYPPCGCGCSTNCQILYFVSHPGPTTGHMLCMNLGIFLPLSSRPPWTFRRAPLLVAMELELRNVLAGGEANGGDIVHKLL